MTRAGLEARNMPGGDSMTVAIGLQTAQTPDAPDPAIIISDPRSSNGLTFPAGLVDRTAATGPKQLVRWVYLAKNTQANDTTLRFCWIAGAVETQKK